MLTAGTAQLEQQRVRSLLAADAVEPFILCWHYAAPALVLGRSQRPSAELASRADRARIGLVERLSGGGAVIAGPWMLSLTLLLPAADPLAHASLPGGYRAVGEACRDALGTLGLRTRLAPAVPARRPLTDALAWACFASASHGELLTADGRKVVGIAQVRRRQAIAICIGLLLSRPDWELLVQLWTGREDPGLVEQLERRTASCAELTAADARPSADALAGALHAGLTTRRLAA